MKVVWLQQSNRFHAAFVSLARERIAALAVGADPFFNTQRHHLVSLVERNRLPTMSFFREFVTAGGLISYGSACRGYRQVGINILKVRSDLHQLVARVRHRSDSVTL